MLEQDYLSRMIKEFSKALIHTLKGSREFDNPLESANSIEKTLENCIDIDRKILLNLQPESMVNMLQVINIDPKLCPFIAFSLQLESHLFKKSGEDELAELRMGQAKAVVKSYNIDIEEPLLDLKEHLREEDLSSLLELGIEFREDEE
ncbi:MAG: hypothetical protein HUJ51_03390 [Eggerthellaceae bacterium]|nr:hypothetical protein [Eggerthellaceae bacterium]